MLGRIKAFCKWRQLVKKVPMEKESNISLCKDASLGKDKRKTWLNFFLQLDVLDTKEQSERDKKLLWVFRNDA